MTAYLEIAKVRYSDSTATVDVAPSVSVSTLTVHLEVSVGALTAYLEPINEDD